MSNIRYKLFFVPFEQDVPCRENHIYHIPAIYHKAKNGDILYRGDTPYESVKPYSRNVELTHRSDKTIRRQDGCVFVPETHPWFNACIFSTVQGRGISPLNSVSMRRGVGMKIIDKIELK